MRNANLQGWATSVVESRHDERLSTAHSAVAGTQAQLTVSKDSLAFDSALPFNHQDSRSDSGLEKVLDHVGIRTQHGLLPFDIGSGSLEVWHDFFCIQFKRMEVAIFVRSANCKYRIPYTVANKLLDLADTLFGCPNYETFLNCLPRDVFLSLPSFFAA